MGPMDADLARWVEGAQNRARTIVPDIVLHAGNPAKVQDVYDFKFPCVDPEKKPSWREYPGWHPYQWQSQGEVYEEVLGPKPARVAPRKGVIR